MSSDANPVQAGMNSVKQATAKIDFKMMWGFVKKAITKPSEALTKDIEQFANIKNSAIFACLVVLLGVLINVITAMIVALNSSKITKSIFGTSKMTKDGWNWDALSKVEYGSIIFKTILAYGLILAVGAGIYFVASSVAKKQANFSKLLAVVSLALLFYLVLAQIAGVLVMKASLQVGMFVSKIGLIYALVLAYEGLNFQIFGDKADQAKIFLNIASLAAIAILFHYINRELMISAPVTDMVKGLDSLKSLKNFFK